MITEYRVVDTLLDPPIMLGDVMCDRDAARAYAEWFSCESIIVQERQVTEWKAS